MCTFYKVTNGQTNVFILQENAKIPHTCNEANRRVAWDARKSCGTDHVGISTSTLPDFFVLGSSYTHGNSFWFSPKCPWKPTSLPLLHFRKTHPQIVPKFGCARQKWFLNKTVHGCVCDLAEQSRALKTELWTKCWVCVWLGWTEPGIEDRVMNAVLGLCVTWLNRAGHWAQCWDWQSQAGYCLQQLCCWWRQLLLVIMSMAYFVLISWPTDSGSSINVAFLVYCE